MQKNVRSSARCAVAALVTCALAVPASAPAAGVPQTIRVGKAPALPRGAQALAPVPAAKQLQLTIALKSQDPSGLADFANAVSTPSTPSFRHYLGVAQFAARFGATPAQLAIVRAALRSQGLSVGQPTANELTLPVYGSAAQVEQALSISLSQVTLRGGRTAYLNAEAPAIPANAAQFVQSVIGLDDLSLNRPAQTPRRAAQAKSFGASSAAAGGLSEASHGDAGQIQIATGGPQPCTAAQALQKESEGGVGQTADQIAEAYEFPGLYNAGDFGAGQTVAVFEQEPFRPQDIAAYQACYGTNASVSAINVDGGPGPYEGEDIEAALDIEQIVGLAPQARVLVYQGPIDQSVAPVDIISRIVSDDSAKVISSSWGICEAITEELGPGVIGAENTLLQEAAAQGQSFYSASGDSGSEQCSQVLERTPEDELLFESLSVLNPASQPFATGVGGTTLYSLSEGEKVFYSGLLAPTEGVWNDGPRSEPDGGGTGGGLSQEWGMPSYQSSAARSVGVISAESSSAPCGLPSLCREVPDVAADADLLTGYVVFIEGDRPGGGWNIVGGTSAAAPLWAALTGLANSSPACHGASIGFANPALYSVASSGYASNFRDVVEPSPFTGAANNDTLFGTGPFSVTPGYDMTTGIGAPLGTNLAASLCSLVSPPPPPAPPAPQPPIPVAAPNVTTSAATSTPAPTPSGVASVSAAQLKALLTALLVPSGKAVKIAALLKAGGYTLSFKAPEAGSVVIDWYELPPGAKLAKKAKPVLVAAGRLAVTAAGTGKVKLKLTAAGKALLRRSKQLKLTAQGTFTPRGKAPVSTTKAFVLKR